MSKKIRINPDTLLYEQEKKKSTFSLKNVLWILLSAIAFAFVFILIAVYLFPSQKEKKLKNDLSVLEKNYDELNQKLEQSILMYNSLSEKEQELDKLTFDSEIKQLQEDFETTDILSPDFNFSKLLNITSKKYDTSEENIRQVILKMRILFDIAYGKQVFAKSVPSILPIEKSKMVLVSGFGERIHPIFKTLRMHNGIDFAARQTTPVRATGDGTVIVTPKQIEGLGNTITIDHGFGYYTIYGCLLKSDVRPGNRINRGQTIGSVGKSGIASGPHLHYEIWLNNKPVNPINYFFLDLKPAEFIDFKERASIKNQSMS